MIRVRNHSILLEVLPVLIDGITLLGLFVYFPKLANRLASPSGLNALLLVGFYLLFCLGVYLIRKLQPATAGKGWQPPPAWTSRKVRTVLAFIFGLLMVTTLAYQIGYFASIQSVGSATLDEGNSAALLVYMPGALLGFSMLYILILAFPVQANVADDGRSFWVLAFLGLALTNAMLIFTSAQALALKQTLMPFATPAVFAISFLVLLLSFGPPRLLLQSKYPSRFALFSFTVLLLFAAWEITVLS